MVGVLIGGIVTKISFSPQGNSSSLKKKDSASLFDARNAGIKERLKKEAAAFEVID